MTPENQNNQLQWQDVLDEKDRNRAESETSAAELKITASPFSEIVWLKISVSKSRGDWNYQVFTEIGGKASSVLCDETGPFATKAAAKVAALTEVIELMDKETARFRELLRRSEQE